MSRHAILNAQPRDVTWNPPRGENLRSPFLFFSISLSRLLIHRTYFPTGCWKSFHFSARKSRGKVNRRATTTAVSLSFSRDRFPSSRFHFYSRYYVTTGTRNVNTDACCPDSQSSERSPADFYFYFYFYFYFFFRSFFSLRGLELLSH